MKPFAELVHDELNRARHLHPQPQSSAHHGWAVLMEEVDELWDQVRLRGEKRDHQNMLTELVQIGAMAQRMAEEVVMAKLWAIPISRESDGAWLIDDESDDGPAIATERELHPSNWGLEPYESDCGKACTPNGCMGHEEMDVIQSITIGGAEFELLQRSVEGEVEWYNTVRACQKLREVITFYVEHHPLDPPQAAVTGSNAWSSVV